MSEERRETDGGRQPENAPFHQGADSSGYADRYEKQSAFRSEKTGAEPGAEKKKRQKPYERPGNEHPDSREPDTVQPPEHRPDSPLRFEEETPPDGAAVTSGQNVPKSKRPHAKFREYSEQARPSERLRQETDAPAGGGGTDKKAVRDKKRLNQSKFRMEKTGAKLETAKTKKTKHALFFGGCYLREMIRRLHV